MTITIASKAPSTSSIRRREKHAVVKSVVRSGNVRSIRPESRVIGSVFRSCTPVNLLPKLQATSGVHIYAWPITNVCAGFVRPKCGRPNGNRRPTVLPAIVKSGCDTEAKNWIGIWISSWT